MSDQVASGPTDNEVVYAFATEAYEAMLAGMNRGIQRGWGLSFRRQYTDEEVVIRLRAAVDDLDQWLNYHRASGGAHAAVLRKKAADVANQAFMLADIVRLRNNPAGRPNDHSGR